ncbi:hypothetical protein [Oceaniglobus roseus]|uniref:hypothetical protein n=1 Tax=Oceaniglobus roseus TaxID=1737570 RepID=UPI000C7F5F17|nr:hypothetical protein [Kandeliimicrobium roseum]
MIPTPANLMAMNGRRLDFDDHLNSGAQMDGVTNKSVTCRLVRHTERLNLRPAHGGAGADHGIWVPYSTNRTVMAHLTGGHSWMASGPFSGCILSVGFDRTAGRAYLAHIAQDNRTNALGEDPFDTWKGHMNRGNLEVWYQNKIPLASQEFYTGTHVFVGIQDMALAYIVKVDVRSSMGGASGPIFNVKVIREAT